MPRWLSLSFFRASTSSASGTDCAEWGVAQIVDPRVARLQNREREKRSPFANKRIRPLKSTVLIPLATARGSVPCHHWIMTSVAEDFWAKPPGRSELGHLSCDFVDQH
ncbi:MAG: hypothetical protein QOK48_2345 [Blastocatellia bacterium]|nr:hypothetical protein [Blastocatellia bacterium]